MIVSGEPARRNSYTTLTDVTDAVDSGGWLAFDVRPKR